MKNIAVVGGKGAGKTDLIKALRAEHPSLNYTHASVYTIEVPITLMSTTDPYLLSGSLDQFVDAVVRSRDIPRKPLTSHEAYDFMNDVISVYGGIVFGRVIHAVTQDMQPVVVDNVSKLVSVEYLKERGFFIVGVDCPLMLRVERILNGQRGKRTDYVNDPFKLRVRMQRRDESMQVMESLRIADVVYNTELLPKDYSDVAKEILQLAA